MKGFRIILPFALSFLFGLLIIPLRGQQAGVRIGLLVPDTSFTREVREARQVIQQANSEGGLDGRVFELVVRTAEGPWGAGSKESVSLVYEDSVLVILGTLDGRNAHLAEQVSARSHVAYIESMASEPTLSQAYVPWFLRVIPNDDQQASALLNFIGKRGGGPVAVLSRGDYDTRFACSSLMKAAVQNNIPGMVELAAGTKEELAAVADELDRLQPRHLIIPFWSAELGNFLVRIAGQFPGLNMYGTLACSSGSMSKGKEGAGPTILPEGMVLVSKWSCADYLSDAVRMTIWSIREAGPDKDAVKSCLMEIRFNEGKTGPVSFDGMGNRRDPVELVRIRNGMPEPF